VFKCAGFIFCSALVFLAGCATSPSNDATEYPDNTPPPNWAGTNLAPRMATVAATVPTNKPVTLPVKTSPATRTNTVATNNAVVQRPPPILTWTSLNHWAAEHHLAAAHRQTDSPMATYGIRSANGIMTLAIGSREALWNGVEIHLGFEPEIIDGEIFLHGLDLQKNLEPLLCAPPLTFSTNHVIVIDPGHGGMNGGTISVLDKRPEKEFTLDLARRLKPLLEQAGWKVFLTRTNDYDVALSNRVAVAESHNADLFISLHFNSVAPDQKPSGLAIFCLTPTGMPSSVARDYPDFWSQNFPNNNYDEQNLQLSVRLQRAILQAPGMGMEDRGVNRARFMGVLRGQRRPSVLIEAGFLSNPHEARRIEDPAFRQKLAEAISAALK
jgi:N-acetylmuramoyl-L-alanine amidase